MRECKTPSGKGNSCRVLGHQHVLSKSFSTVVDSRNKTNTKKKPVSKCQLTDLHHLPGFLGKQEFIFTGLFLGGKSDMAFFLPSTDLILL